MRLCAARATSEERFTRELPVRNAEKMRLQIRYESARGGHPGYFQREGVSLETDLSPNSSLFKIKNRLTHQLARHSMKPWMYFGLFVFNNKPTYKSKKKQKLNFLQLFFKCFNRSYRCENFEVTECRSTERPQYQEGATFSVLNWICRERLSLSTLLC